MQKWMKGKNPVELALDSVKNFPYPTVAMLNGYAFGAGLNLAICCDIDGFQVLQKIRQFSSVPVIMLTAKTQEDDEIKGLIPTHITTKGELDALELENIVRATFYWLSHRRFHSIMS